MMYRTLISTSDLAGHLEDAGWVIVDCRFSLGDAERGRKDYARGHVPRAVYAHLDDDLSGPVVPGQTGRHPLPSPERAAETFGRLGISDDVQVVAYDDAGGAIAARLWWMLHYFGHEAAAVLEGGWIAWKQERRAAASGVETNSQRTFTPRVQEAWTVDAEGLDAVREDRSWKVLDARDSTRYFGEVEPIDPVAGHIPGALSAPYMENLDEFGRFRTVEALRGRFEGLVGATPPDRVVSYCGSGVTACHNLLAMEHAGLSGGRLYPGSWSEWITDPDRETG